MKELNYEKTDREGIYESANDITEGGVSASALKNNSDFAALWCKSLCEIQKFLIDDCNTLEAEVERLREENETLEAEVERLREENEELRHDLAYAWE